MNPTYPLNSILYGPPGTGKTYLCLQKAVQLVENLDEDTFKQKYTDEEVQKRFRQYQQEGKIALVTFHPSFVYEDFVEGLKPFKNEKDDLFYDIEDGIFKQVCLNASYALYQQQQKRLLNQKKDGYKRNFEAIYHEFLDYLKRMMREESQEVVFETKSEKPLYLLDINKNDTLHFRYGKGSRTYGVTRASMAALYRTFDSMEDIKQVNEDIQKLTGKSNTSLYWAVFNRLKNFERTRNTTYNYLLNSRRLMGRPINDELYQNMKREISQFDFHQLSAEDYAKAGNFVLIIDEINRGNVAAIMGELITLLENDKRAGSAFAMSTILPYSREAFSVPANLYILGSMNTADRSITHLDTALRRRFSFREIQPQPELLNAKASPEGSGKHGSQLAESQVAYQKKSGALQKLNIDLAAMLRMINARLEKLLDRNHTIGHAYLLPVLTSPEPLQNLRQVFYQQLIPLLEAYFFSDTAKIQMVIGKSFFQAAKSDPTFFFPGQEYSSFNDTPEYVSAPLAELDDAAFVQAIRNIYASSAT
jgi:5-methylcytosine-specific restriction protein B